MPKHKIKVTEAVSRSRCQRSDVVGIHLLKVSGEWVSLSDELVSTSPQLLLSSNRSPLETSPTTFYGRGKHRASSASKPRQIVLGDTSLPASTANKSLPSSTASKPRQKALGDTSATANKSRQKVLGDTSLPSSTASKPRRKVLTAARQSLLNTVDRMPVPLLKCKSEKLISRAKRVRRKLQVVDRFTQQSIRSWLSIKSQPFDLCVDENQPQRATVMGQKFARQVSCDGVESPAPDADRFLPKAASSPVDDVDVKRTLYSTSRKRISFETASAVSVDEPEAEATSVSDEVNTRDEEPVVTQVDSSFVIHPDVKLEVSRDGNVQGSECEAQQAVNVSDIARASTKASSIIHKSLGVATDDFSCPGSPSRVSVGSLKVNEEISFDGSAGLDVSRHVMDLDLPCDMAVTSGNAARHTTSDNAARHTTSDNAARHTTSGNAARHTTSVNAARHTTSGNTARHTTSVNTARHTTSGNAARHTTSGNTVQRPRTVCKRKASSCAEEETERVTQQQDDDVKLVYERNLYQDLEGVPMVVLQKMSKAVLLKYYKIVVDH